MSQPQAQPMAQTPQPTVSHAPSTTEPPRSFSRPTTAHGNPQDAITPAPAHPSRPATAAPAAQTTTPAADQLSYNETLNNADRLWKFKTAFNAILVIAGIIGLGCTAWLTGSRPTFGLMSDYEAYWSTWPSIITFTISFLWCAVCIIVFLVRKNSIHPGARVAMHLLLWLAFVATALLILVSWFEIYNWGLNGRLYRYSYYSSSDEGDYRLMTNNNTWVWVPETDYYDNISYGNVTRDCTGRNSFFYYSDVEFSNCDEQDAFINKLWQDKPTREAVTMTAVVCNWLSLLLHFVVFVWACVDCHRFNRKKNNKDAEKIAAGIVQTMITNGAIMPPPGQAYMRPAMGQGMYYQLPSQAYPMQAMPAQGGVQPQQQAGYGYYPMAAPQQQPQQAMPGPSNEKSNGPRYA